MLEDEKDTEKNREYMGDRTKQSDPDQKCEKNPEE